MKEITKDIIQDLLPLYVAGEASADTNALVRDYLAADPELAETAKEMAKADSLNKVPIPFGKDAALETYEEAKKWMTVRTLGLAFLAAIVLMCVLLAAVVGTSIDRIAELFLR